MRKVLDIRLDGFHIVCIMYKEGLNPFRVYRVTADHRRQIAKYGDFISVLCFVRDLYIAGADTLTFPQLVEWAKRYEGK